MRHFDNEYVTQPKLTIWRTHCNLAQSLADMAVLMRSKADFYSYIVDNEAEYDLTVNKSSDNFYTRLERYNVEWFFENTLIMVRTCSNTGSVRYDFHDLQLDGSALTLTLNAHTPEVGTCDMADFHLLLELPIPASTFDALTLNWQHEA